MAHTPVDESSTGSTPAAEAERSADESVTEAVISTVADVTDSDPTSMTPLYDVVDPEALDKLFRTDGLGTDRTPSRIEFAYGGCDVAVTGDGVVRVSRLR